MTKRIVILFVCVLVLSGLIFLLSPKIKINTANQNSAPSNVNSVSIECERNSDCVIGGCSGTACLPRDKASQAYTTCEWRPEYACYAQDSCLCGGGRCQWAGSQAYAACVRQLK